jgi:multiple sugar transport system permease protein
MLYALALSFGASSSGGGYQWAGLSNYSSAIRGQGFWNAAANTLVFTGTSVIGQFGLGLTFALALYQVQQRIGALIRPIYIIPWAIMPVVVATVWSWILNPNGGLLNGILAGLGVLDAPLAWLGDPALAMPSVIITNIWRGTPFVTLMLYAALQGVSRDLYEAAALDGAGWMRLTWSVTLPTIRSTVGVVLLLDTVWNFKLFDLNQVMTAGGPQGATDILPTLIYRTAFQNGDFSTAAAIAMLMLVLTVALTVGMSAAGLGSPADEEEL